MKITWETRDAGTTWNKSLPCIISPATSDGEVHGFLSKHVFFQSRVVSCETEVGCWDPQVDPGLPVPRHTPTVLNSTRHFSQSSHSRGHHNRSDVDIFHNANYQPQYFSSSIQSLSLLLEVVTNRQ